VGRLASRGGREGTIKKVTGWKNDPKRKERGVKTIKEKRGWGYGLKTRFHQAGSEDFQGEKGEGKKGTGRKRKREIQ